MANTYYDSQLTAEEIESVLEAINGILNPANNGKVLAISNGRLEAQSVQWGGGSPVIEPLSITQNGTYTAPSGVDGYSPVTVNVSGGSFDPFPTSNVITTEYTKLLDSPEQFFCNRYWFHDVVTPQVVFPLPSDPQLPVSADECPLNWPNIVEIDPEKSYVLYAVLKTSTDNNRCLNFWATNQDTKNILISIYWYQGSLYKYADGGGSVIKTGVTDYFAIAVKLDVSTNVISFYCDKALKATATNTRTRNRAQLNGTGIHGSFYVYDSVEYIKHFAVVEGADTDATIIANLTALETLYGIS